MNKHIWLIGLAFFLGLSAKETSCRKGSASGGGQAATEARSADFLLKKLKAQNRVGLKTMNAHARISFESEAESLNASANIVWLRDSALWVNIKKFGIEGARVLITRDSVFVLNRIDKTYSARGLESLQRNYSLPAGFELLQSLVLAEPWFFSDMKLESDIKDEQHRLSGNNGRFAADYRVAEQDFWLHQEVFLQPRDARTVSALFENHKKNAVAGWFPYLRTVEAFSPETGNLRVSIDLNDVEFNVPKSFRFEVPSHYERI